VTQVREEIAIIQGAERLNANGAEAQRGLRVRVLPQTVTGVLADTDREKRLRASARGGHCGNGRSLQP
jgi:hypothetical protein